MSSKGSPITEDGNNNVVRLDELSPIFIHRILLSDPSEFDTLTLSGAPRPASLSFHQHVDHFKITDSNRRGDDAVSLEQQISKTMRKAYYDMILASMKDLHSYSPLQPLLLEVVTLIQTQILPNRDDFTDQFTSMTQLIQNCDMKTLQPILNIMIVMGERLMQLESEERSVTTFEWIRSVKSTLLTTITTTTSTCFQEEEESTVSLPLFYHDDNNDLSIDTYSDAKVIQLTFPQMGLASVTYLLEKTQQCISDMDDWKIGHMIAPLVHLQGREYEYHQFEAKFGIYGNDTSAAKYTRSWVKEIMDCSEFTEEEIISSPEKRRLAIVQTGWIDNILFRSPRVPSTSTSSKDNLTTPDPPIQKESFHMPEVLHLDTDAVKIIRTTTLLSVVCSALALHAVTVANVNDSILKVSPLGSHLEERRLTLIAALKNGAFFKDQSDYEAHVGEALVELALALNANLSEEGKVTLKSRAVLVMKNEDPVIKLLDNRMRQIFRSMVTWTPKDSQVPTSIKTGYAIDNFGDRAKRQSSSEIFKAAAQEEFVKKGFTFNAVELAESALLASRVINLALDIFGVPILDKLFFDMATRKEEKK